MNARTVGRGISNNGVIEVLISKTKHGMLRIVHRNNCELGDEILRKIVKSMEKQPDNEESGVTLWSLSCFIKREWVRIAHIILKKASDKDKMESAWQTLKKMLDPNAGFHITAKIDSEKGLLWYEIPILWETYQKKLEL